MTLKLVRKNCSLELKLLYGTKLAFDRLGGPFFFLKEVSNFVMDNNIFGLSSLFFTRQDSKLPIFLLTKIFLNNFLCIKIILSYL